MKQIQAGLLDVGYVDLGPPGGPAVVLLHGWPYDIHSFVEVAPLLAEGGYRVVVPFLRGYGTTRFLANDTMRNGQQAAVAQDIVALMDALGIRQAAIGGFDWGSRTTCVLAALWPERCRAIVSVSGYLITNLKANQQPLPPAAEHAWWYQYYFATERGRLGYTANRYELNKLMWQIASPKWRFDDATYKRTAAAFDNPDHADIVIHNYRWRLSLADGERRYDALEKKLAEAPIIAVPAVTIGSDFDGAAADGAAYAKMFSGRHTHHVLPGIGHNVPQEAPRAFAAAIVEADRAASMKPIVIVFAVLFAVVLAIVPATWTAEAPVATGPSLAGATGWLNSPPLRAEDLRGNVVVADARYGLSSTTTTRALNRAEAPCGRAPRG